MSRSAFWFRLLAAIALKPQLLLTAAALTIRCRPVKWWCPPRFVLPSREWIEFRLGAVFGRTYGDLEIDDVVRYLAWCRSFPGPVS